MVESRLSTLASLIPLGPIQWVFAWIYLHQGHNPSMEGWTFLVLCLFRFVLSPPPCGRDHGSQQWEGCSLTWFIFPLVKCYHSLTQWRVLCLIGISRVFYTLAALDIERNCWISEYGVPYLTPLGFPNVPVVGGILHLPGAMQCFSHWSPGIWEEVSRIPSQCSWKPAAADPAVQLACSSPWCWGQEEVALPSFGRSH